MRSLNCFPFCSRSHSLNCAESRDRQQCTCGEKNFHQVSVSLTAAGSEGMFMLMGKGGYLCILYEVILLCDLVYLFIPS